VKLKKKSVKTDPPACTVTPSLLEYITVLFNQTTEITGMGQKYGICF
jgi:hypothetical protein